jgi:hypothetical protein
VDLFKKDPFFGTGRKGSGTSANLPKKNRSIFKGTFVKH